MSCLARNDEEPEIAIYDEPVVCRAKASLPAKFLYIKHCGVKSKRGLGVFAKKEIPRRTLFGPLEGQIVDDDGNRNVDVFHFLVDVDGTFRRVDTSSEFLSNWMMFVKPAESMDEQNLVLQQQGKNLYFCSIRTIKPKEELRVWYGNNYAKSRSIIADRIMCGKKARSSSGNGYSLDPNPSQQPFNLNEFCKRWPCSHCSMVFDSATKLNFHTLTHAADDIEINEQILLQNEEAGFSTAASQFLDLPGSSTDLQGPDALAGPSKRDEKTFQCPICEEIFARVALLKDHVHSHAANGIYTCPTCEKQFSTYKLIRNHIRIYHGERKFFCTTCFKKFPTRDKLKSHKMSHTGVKPFLCSNCGKQFRRRDKLGEHQKRIHQDDGSSPKKPKKARPRKPLVKQVKDGEVVKNGVERLFNCDLCLTAFKRRGMLVNHLATRHPDIVIESVPELKQPIVKMWKDYFCSYCEKVYKSASKRKSHVLKHHPGKEVPCGDRESTSPTVKTTHSGNLSEECGSYTTVPQKCSWCHRQYATRAKLLQHQRQKHLDLMPKSLKEPKKPTQISDTGLLLKEDRQAGQDSSYAEEEVLILENPLEENLSEYESHLGEKLVGEREFIIDAPTLRKVLRDDAISTDCSAETLTDLNQILDTRPDQYFRIVQTSNGISYARPIEVWDPCQPLSPEAPDASLLS
ncbi:ZnF_C2H2 [Nesidiocoris tenuis]|uniref:ZnF_C2H2 n=1 Tax=Nesidiocoris tenuis TaxID=355587 RepID=A0ABN7ARJ2_9HEMI|nr:ZnF_C2H2 [Nesidiocoris tenuis]